MPLAVGSTTVSADAAATAASKALPPRSSACMPAAEACGVEQFTIACPAYIGNRWDG